ncbi:sensor histidine kinase [Paenibacillus cremeus]|uniref:histidine kinase n=2 Tax=Paenibacillus cremeus TaxID=2163881 RepID=A0A559K5W0_9BACL|nr:sensor histidine kinase [Paenibacillus cremeus]
MLAGFVSVMIVVLVCVGLLTFNSVSTLLNTKAETQMKQTASLTDGRLEALINQMDTLTLQAINDPRLQQLFFSLANGEAVSFSQRQAMMQIYNHIQAYSNGVNSVELYSSDLKRMYPLDEQSLTNRVTSNWIDQADKEKGKLVWIGNDPRDPDSVLAIRRINLIDRWFSNGGYLLVTIKRSYFEFQAEMSQSGHRELMLLADSASRPIVGDGSALAVVSELMQEDSDKVTLEGQRYILVKKLSEKTGWTLMILYPVSEITDGISILRVAIFVSGAIGSVLFTILSFLLSMMITQPILRLMRAMRNTRQGVLKPNLSKTYTTELNDLNMTYNQMVENINRLIKLVYEKEILQSRTELLALQAQINPHFLYNTLEALYWSLEGKGEEELANLVVSMSDLFRYVISGPNKEEWVTLGDELDHVKRYLGIISVRFGSRLEWQIHAADQFSSVPIPKLLIQPLVENAILHGMEGKTGPGLVTITVEPSPMNPSDLRITVSDDGPGMDDRTRRDVMGAGNSESTSSGKGKGMGLSNVMRRIKLYYPSQAGENRGLSIDSTPGQGTSVRFDIPIHREVHHDSIGENNSSR